MSGESEKGNDQRNPDDRSIPPEAFEDVYSEKPRKVGFFQRVYRSVTDLDFYRLVAVESWTRALFYALKLVVLVSVLMSALMLYQTLPLVSEALVNVQQQLRPVTFKNGDISVEGDVPHRVTLIKDYEIIFDPDASLNRMKLPPSVLAVFVDGGCYYRAQGEDFQFMSLASGTKSKPMTINANTIRSNQTIIYAVVIVTNIFGSLLLQLFMNAVRVGLITLGGWFLTRTAQPSAGVPTLIRFTCYVITPIVGLDLFLTLVGVPLGSIGSTLEIAFLVLGSIFLYRIHEHVKPRNPDAENDGHRI